MKIALDYDKTYTADPDLWIPFLYGARQLGHEVYVVTFRGADCPIEKTPPNIRGIFYTDATPKKEFMDTLGIYIDIWIDDDPELIINHSDWTKEDRERWKQANGF